MSQRPLAPIQLVSADRMLKDTAEIARWVRLSGSPDELRAFEYVAEQLRACGFQTNLILHDAYISLPGPARLEVSGLGEIPCITHAFGGNTDCELLLVDGRDPNADATGKAIMLDGLAAGEEELTARQRGAAALIMVNDHHLHEMIISNVWGSPTRNQLDRLPSLPTISVIDADGRRLREQLALGPVAVRIKTEVEVGWRKTPILLADLPAPKGLNPFVLFSGHIDSWHYGAMDNGTANATMMEVGRLMAKHRDQMVRGLRLAFWSGHSHGRYSGSTWFADNYFQELYDHCVCHVNIDSVGGAGATVLAEAMCMPETRAVGAAAVGAVTGQSFRGSRVNRSSDQSFTGVGIPSLFALLSEHPEGGPNSTTMWGPGTGGLGWWWHTTEDLIDKIDPEFLRRDAAIYLEAVWRLLTEPLLPFDYAVTVQNFNALLEKRQDEAGATLDLNPALAETVMLAEAVASLQERVEAGRLSPAQVEAVNRCLMRLGRHLIPVEYTESGPFAHDLAFAVPALPGLEAVRELANLPADSADFKFLYPLLVRARNRIVRALKNAQEEVALARRALGEE